MSAIDSNNETFHVRDVETASRWADSVSEAAERGEASGSTAGSSTERHLHQVRVHHKNGSDYLVTQRTTHRRSTTGRTVSASTP